MMTRTLKRQFFYVISGILLLPLVLMLLFHSRMNSAQEIVKSSYSEEEFIQIIAPRAQVLGDAYGIYPSIIIGQAAYESNFGQTFLATKYHNLMNLEAQPGQEQIRLKNAEDEKVRYATYNSWNDSLDDYLYRLQNDERLSEEVYKNLVGSFDYEVATEQLSSHYSSAKNYGKNILKIIEDYNLTQYDSPKE